MGFSYHWFTEKEQLRLKYSAEIYKESLWILKKIKIKKKS